MHPIVSSDRLSPRSDHCHDASQVAVQPILPLPSQINITAHVAVLSGLPDSQTLGKLLYTRSQVYATLEDRNRGSARYLECAIQEDIYHDGESNSRCAGIILLDRIESTQVHLNSILLRSPICSISIILLNWCTLTYTWMQPERFERPDRLIGFEFLRVCIEPSSSDSGSRMPEVKSKKNGIK